MGVYMGIDPSLTGTAVAAVDESGHLEVWRLATAGGEDASHKETMHRLTRIERWLRDRFEQVAGEQQIVGVGIEGPSLAPQRMGRDHERAGLWWRAFTRASMYTPDVVVISPKQRAKYACGNGNGTKDAVLLGVCRRWPSFVGGNDEADAVTIASMVARLDGTPVDGRIPKPCLAALDKLRSTR